MTEDEAKTKWCPFVRVAAEPVDGPINRWATDYDDAPNPFGDHNACIGSACMAWRTRKVSVPNRFDVSSHEEDRGYCGLAGKP